MPVSHALTIDVEDYFQVSAFETHIPRSSWESFESRIEGNTHRVLDILARNSTRATFFILGWVADHYPKLVQEIHSAGHEIASHGYWHRLVYDQTPDEFRADVRQAKEALSQLIGKDVIAYRAPSFSITERSLWALQILVEEGYKVDSSIFPVHHDRYGIPTAEREFHELTTSAGKLWECPPTVHSIGKLNIPVAGGGYFRLFPLFWTRYCLRQTASRNQPFLLYLHPWEFDPDQPSLKVGSRLTRLRHHINLATTEAKLGSLLKEFSFTSLSDVLDSCRVGQSDCND